MTGTIYIFGVLYTFNDNLSVHALNSKILLTQAHGLSTYCLYE